MLPKRPPRTPRSDSPPVGPPGFAQAWLVAFVLLSLYLGITLAAAICVAWGPKTEGDFACGSPGIYLRCEDVAEQDLVIEFSEFRYDWDGAGCILRAQPMTDTAIANVTLRVEEEGLVLAGQPLRVGEEVTGRVTLFPFSPWLVHVRRFAARLDRQYRCCTGPEQCAPQAVAAYVSGEVHAGLRPNPVGLVLLVVDGALWYFYRRARRPEAEPQPEGDEGDRGESTRGDPPPGERPGA